MYSSPRLHDSAKLNVAFELNTVMTMLVHELGKGHAALPKFQTVLGLSNMHLKTFQRHNRKVHQACQSVADTSLDTATEIIRGGYGDLMDDGSSTLLSAMTVHGRRGFYLTSLRRSRHQRTDWSGSLSMKYCRITATHVPYYHRLINSC